MNIPCGIVSHYTLLQTVHSGFNSSVFLARDEFTDCLSAVKVFPRHSVSFSIETEALKLLAGRRNVIAAVEWEKGAVMKDDEGHSEVVDYLAMEYWQKGALIDVVLKSSEIDECIVRKWFREVMVAVDHCHRAGVAHLDIKLDNVLLSDCYSAVLSDFGCATNSAFNSMCLSRGTASYQPPEAHAGGLVSPLAVDIFSAGVLLFCLFMRQPPFQEASGKCPHYLRLLQEPLEYWRVREQRCSYLGEQLIDLVMWMMCPSPEDRPSAQEVLSHPWLKGRDASVEEIQGSLRV